MLLSSITVHVDPDEQYMTRRTESRPRRVIYNWLLHCHMLCKIEEYMQYIYFRSRIVRAGALTSVNLLTGGKYLWEFRGEKGKKT